MHSLVTFTAEYLLFILIAVAGVYWLSQTKKLKLKILIIGILGSLIALVLINISSALFYDPRPFVSEAVVPYFAHAADNGFPSDHTTLAAVVGATMLFISRRLGISLLFGAVLVGGARVIAHVHSPIDIIGGLIIGIASVYTAQLVYILWIKKTQRQMTTQQ